MQLAKHSCDLGFLKKMEELQNDSNLDDTSSLISNSPSPYLNMTTNTQSLDEEIEEVMLKYFPLFVMLIHVLVKREVQHHASMTAAGVSEYFQSAFDLMQC